MPTPCLKRGPSPSHEGAQVTQARRKVMRKSPEVSWGERKKWRKWRRGSWPTCVVGELWEKIWGVSSFSFKGEIHPTFPCFVILQLWFLNHSDTSENAVLNVHSYSLESKIFGGNGREGPYEVALPLLVTWTESVVWMWCCVLSRAIYYSLGNRKYHLFPFMQTINQHDISSMWSNAAQCASTWEEQICSKFWNT